MHRVLRTTAPPNLAQIAQRLIPKSAPEGLTFFHIGELVQRLYILRSGEVALIGPDDPTRRPVRAKPTQVAGQHAFFTDGRHTVTAAATEDCDFYVLRRKDLDALFAESLGRQQAMADYLKREQISDYPKARSNGQKLRRRRDGMPPGNLDV